MRFDYSSMQTSQPVIPLGGAMHRLRPDVPLIITGPQGSRVTDAVLDTGSDDTVFPTRFAHLIGLSLDGVPTGIAQSIGGSQLTCRYATVSLRLSDGIEVAVWQTVVAFADGILRPLLGHVGFFDYFDVTFRGATKDVTIFPNTAFVGSYQRP